MTLHASAGAVDSAPWHFLCHPENAPNCPWKKPSMAFFHLGDTQKAKVFGVAGRRFLRRQTLSTVC